MSDDTIVAYQEELEFESSQAIFEQEKSDESVQSSSEEADSSIYTPLTRVEVSPLWRYVIVNIYSTKNNTLVVLTDRSSSQQLGSFSGGQLTKSDRLKGSVKVAELMYPKIAERLKFFNASHLEVRVRAQGSMNIRMPTNASRALIALISRNFNVVRVLKCTPEMYGMMRPKSIRRVR